eukprot:CAMPEP_0170280532 /NCGR_PEP_ID=MMETSP0116_2-20130129/40279_1 /TAXON_ID=400756 /ORGANISM="Durinskia baltica, Strain CSIRO CS-38" /LENGTH=329 /DNA_ID=CAMNT_0010531861 /DNA_START=182 /DNA_END=1172 /DNA_ORIENTATION=+
MGRRAQAPRSIEPLEASATGDRLEGVVRDLCIAEAQGPELWATGGQGDHAAIRQLHDPTAVEDLQVPGAPCDAFDSLIRDLRVRNMQLSDGARGPGLEGRVRDLRAEGQVQRLNAEVEEQLRSDLVGDGQAAKGQTQALQEGSALHDATHQTLRGHLAALADGELMKAQQTRKRRLPQRRGKGAVRNPRATVQPQGAQVLAMLQDVPHNAIVHLLAAPHIESTKVREERPIVFSRHLRKCEEPSKYNFRVCRVRACGSTLSFKAFFVTSFSSKASKAPRGKPESLPKRTFFGPYLIKIWANFRTQSSTNDADSAHGGSMDGMLPTFAVC